MDTTDFMEDDNHGAAPHGDVPRAPCDAGAATGVVVDVRPGNWRRGKVRRDPRTVLSVTHDEMIAERYHLDAVRSVDADANRCHVGERGHTSVRAVESSAADDEAVRRAIHGDVRVDALARA